MLELTMTPATAVLIVVILVGVFFAIRRLVRKGLCDCDEKCDRCKGGKGHCGAAEDMVARMEKAAKKGYH